MLSRLQTPLLFAILSAATLGWLGAWRLSDSPFPFPDYTAQVAQYRPLYLLTKGRVSAQVPNFVWCIELNPEIEYAVQTQSQIGYVKHNTLNPYPTQYKGEPIIAAATVGVQRRVDEFGALAPIATRTIRKFEFFPIGPYPQMPDEAAYNAFCGSSDPIAHALPESGEVLWKFRPLAAVHDGLFLFTIIAWFLSLVSMPKWSIWRHLTPAQRRRARGCCPRCNYNLEGLATPTCPECGKQLPSHRAPVS